MLSGRICSQGAKVYDEIPNYGFCQCHLPQVLATLWVGKNRHMGWSGWQLPVIVGWGSWSRNLSFQDLAFLLSAQFGRARAAVRGSGSHPTSKAKHMWPPWGGGQGFSGAVAWMGLVKGYPQGWGSCVSWQTPDSVARDLCSPQWQRMALQLGRVDSSIALWGRRARGGDSSVVSTWTWPLLPVAAAAWHEIVLSLF